VTGPDDASAIAASADDPDEFLVVFDRHFDAVYRYLARRVGAAAAEDLAAEAFAQAFASRARYDAAVADARPWLYGIASRLLRRHWRTEERRLRAYARTGVDPLAGGDSGPSDPAVARALADLSREERDTILLYAWADLGYDEIAQATGVPVGTVRSRLHRARRLMRVALAPAPSLASDCEVLDG
jgi:DNA-directed RNA polymerase specialized sigma24 family protein